MTYTADGLNRITAANANTFSYDGNGNLTSDSLTAYAYDVENRLVSASGQNTAGLRYDPFGRLYEVTDAQGGIRRFLHDGDDLALEYGPTGTVLARHLHGLGSGDDPLISFTGSSASYLDAEYLYTDRLGSVIARYRRDGTPAAINGYDEYGVPGPSSGVNNNGRFRYTGQVWLPELGLYYYKARMYSPTIGRFMQTDPIGYADGMNMYAYVGNDPVNGVDPTGLQEAPGWTVTGSRYEGLYCDQPNNYGPCNASLRLMQTPLDFDLADFIPDFLSEIVVIGRPMQGPTFCGDTLQENGRIEYNVTSGNLFLLAGFQGSRGTWRNLKTGSHGDYTTIGGGLGVGIGLTGDYGQVTSLRDFSGYGETASAGLSAGPLGVGASASQNEKGEWVGGGGSVDIPGAAVDLLKFKGLGFTASSTVGETSINNCVVGGN